MGELCICLPSWLLWTLAGTVGGLAYLRAGLAMARWYYRHDKDKEMGEALTAGIFWPLCLAIIWIAREIRKE